MNNSLKFLSLFFFFFFSSSFNNLNCHSLHSPQDPRKETSIEKEILSCGVAVFAMVDAWSKKRDNPTNLM